MLCVKFIAVCFSIDNCTIFFLWHFVKLSIQRLKWKINWIASVKLFITDELLFRSNLYVPGFQNLTFGDKFKRIVFKSFRFDRNNSSSVMNNFTDAIQFIFHFNRWILSLTKCHRKKIEQLSIEKHTAMNLTHNIYEPCCYDAIYYWQHLEKKRCLLQWLKRKLAEQNERKNWPYWNQKRPFLTLLFSNNVQRNSIKIYLGAWIEAEIFGYCRFMELVQSHLWLALAEICPTRSTNDVETNIVETIENIYYRKDCIRSTFI